MKRNETIKLDELHCNKNRIIFFIHTFCFGSELFFCVYASFSRAGTCLHARSLASLWSARLRVLFVVVFVDVRYVKNIIKYIYESRRKKKNPQKRKEQENTLGREYNTRMNTHRDTHVHAIHWDPDCVILE